MSFGGKIDLSYFEKLQEEIDDSTIRNEEDIFKNKINKMNIKKPKNKKNVNKHRVKKDRFQEE